jgi:hypothetical protein
MNTQAKSSILIILIFLCIILTYYFFKKNFKIKNQQENNVQNQNSTVPYENKIDSSGGQQINTLIQYGQKITLSPDFSFAQFDDFSLSRKNDSNPKEFTIRSKKTDTEITLLLNNYEKSFSLDSDTFLITLGRMYMTSIQGKEEEVEFFTISKN